MGFIFPVWKNPPDDGREQWMFLGPNEWKVKVVQSFLAIFGFFSCCRRLYILWFLFLWSILDEESVDSQLFVNKSNSEKKSLF